jgi:Flp pilus assembly protein TadD
LAASERSEEERRQAYALNNEGASYLRQGKPEKALSPLRQAIEILPDDPSIMLNLGGAYILLGRYIEAEAVLSRAAEIAPDNPLIWSNLGAAVLRLNLGTEDECQRRAIAAFRRALELDATAPSVAYNLALVYREREEWEEAARCFQLAIEANPADRDARSLYEKMREQAARSRDLPGGA